MTPFTPEEIQLIVHAPMTVGLAVAMVDMGIISTAIEAAAMAKEITSAATKYPDNAIIQAAFSEESLKTTKLEKPEIKAEDVESGAFVEQALAAVQKTVEMLSDKASTQDISEYQQFLYDCGDAVAQAAGSGLFGTGAKVSAEEALLLTKLKAALGLSSTANS